MNVVELSRTSFRIVELPYLDDTFVEIVEQACIDTHFSEVFPKGLPMSAAAADWTMVNADHSITPDIGRRLA